MSLEWLFLAGAVRLIFFLAPFLRVEKEFNLGGDNLEEAKEFANAGSCRALLASLPAAFLVVVLAEADKRCPRGVEPAIIALYVLVVIGLVYLSVKIPASQFRGVLRPIAWFVAVTVVEVIMQALLMNSAVQATCYSAGGVAPRI